MSSKPRRGTVRWNSPPPARSRKSKQSSATSSTFRRLLPLLLSSLTVHLSHLFSLAHGNPLHPFSSTLSLGRNLRHLPCVVRSSGQEGVCMFAIDCFKANGTHLGVCIDKIFFGSCCQVNDDNLLFNHEITDNSIDHNHHSNFPVIDTNKKPVITETRFPTTAAPKNDTKYELVSTSSTTTHRTTSKINRRNSTTSAVPFRDDVPSTTEYQEFSTFQFIQSSKGPSRTTTKPNEKSTTRKPPQRNTTKPIKTRRPTPSRTNTKRPTTTQTVLLDTKQNSTALPSVNQRPVTSTDASSTGISRRPTTTAATTIRSTTVNSRRPTTTAPSSTTAHVEETTFPPRTRRPTTAHPTTAGVVPLTRPTNRRRPTLATSTAAPVTENDTTRAPRPRPRPTSQIVTTPATSLEHLLDDLVSTTLKSSSAKVDVTYPITTVKVTEATTPTTTPKPASRKPTKTTSTTLSTTPTTTPTTTSTTTEQTTTSTAGSPKTTAPGRITPPADIDYQPETSQTENIVDETTTGSGLVTWSSISVDSSSDKTVSEQATSTVAPEILIEISGPTTEKDTAPVRPDSTEPVTIEPVTEVTTLEGEEEEEEEGSEEGSGESEEESGEEEEEVSSSETLDTTSETIVAATLESDKLVNTTVAPELASSTINTTTVVEESTTVGTSTTLNITSSLQSIASMFNITTSSPGAPVRFPEDNKTAGSTVGYGNVTTVRPTLLVNGTEGSATTLLPDSTMPSLEEIDYRAVCGKRMFPEPRIVGGTKASFGRWPWQISLRQWRTSTYLHKCGAALLNENWAITAAHCVDNVPPSDLLLRLGEYDLALEEEPYGYQERRVQIVASHPQFDPRTFEYDLALLRFYEPVVFQPNIIPVCVPENDENFIGRTAFVTGWGRLYEDGPLPSVLQEVTVPVIENKICEAMYRSAGYIEHIPHIFICAGWKKGGYDSCEGDSGGPMVIQRGDKRFQLAGVISWGIGCAEANQPGVYTRISEFRDWINQILQF
ncbi:serine proteinase stubble-like isoform X4 [Uranotaenia lowii]|uniref:serine proteinase stubble-like isoform X4 n=1 Tax=Uranotaenia lowii TaxID=190385 RepID=UPI00247ABEAB|nr:serine proteinase stubble-like isoform X4 [Uranotaenia lowii]